MTDELRLTLLIALNLATILLTGYLAGRYAARQIQKLLEAEWQRTEEARRQAQAEVMASLPSVPPELEQMVEMERWVLTARDLQHLLASLGMLVRVGLRADESSRRGVLAELDRSLKFFGRLEGKWLDSSLPVVSYARQLDPAKGKARDQSLETWISRLSRAHVQATQSLRRAASLCNPGDEEYSDVLANTYLGEADRAAADMASVIASALDRVAYLKKQLPERQAQQVAAEVAERMGGTLEVLEGGEVSEGDGIKSEVEVSSALAVDLAEPANRVAR
jgi:hypothetical protein